MSATNWFISLEGVAATVATLPESRRFHYPLAHGTMRIGLYVPHGKDEQTPHAQDELYIIASGEGMFVKGSERRPFKPQDAIFVEAGMPHKFEEFTEDFQSWVIFWGPQGGEV
jgi:mannose-6-phosphate isomerase-like protein (cupin superfamily)